MAKKAESTLKNMLLSLTLIAFVASMTLAFVNNVTKAPIEKVKQQKISDAVKSVLSAEMPDGSVAPIYKNYVKDSVVLQVKKGDKVIDQTIYRYVGLDADGNMVGKAVESFSNTGFGGKIRAMVGFDSEGNILGYEILESSETPGLGAKADKWFQKDGKGNVIGMNPSTNNMTVVKDGGEVDAITGSTITSRAFCDLVATAYEAFKIEKGETGI